MNCIKTGKVNVYLYGLVDLGVTIFYMAQVIGMSRGELSVFVSLQDFFKKRLPYDVLFVSVCRSTVSGDSTTVFC